MSVLKSVKSFDLFRCLVVPSLFLCVIFHHPAFQWIAVGGLAIWLGFVLVGICAAAIKKQQVVQKKAPEISDKAKADDASPACMTPEGELLLIRQINSRITEQLKGTYPAVSWLWVKRPTVDEFCKGGVWRIQVSNTEPFNFAEVDMTMSGKMTITMLQTATLKEAQVLEEVSDLKDDELIDRMDVKSWYQSEGEEILAQIIDDLNTQGHRTLVLHENGDACIEVSDKEQMVEKIKNFPPRMVWDEFCQMLRADDITAAVNSDSLMLSW